MAKRHHVRFKAHEKVSKPVLVDFTRKDGIEVVFSGHKSVKMPIEINFMAKNN